MTSLTVGGPGELVFDPMAGFGTTLMEAIGVLDGVPVAQVARQFGTSRQSVHAWLKWFEAEGEQGLMERSLRPRTSPTRLAAEVEALVCELRRSHPRWRPRRIAHELGRRGISPAPGRTTVYRVLVRNNLVEPQEQQHRRKYRRKYRRWQRYTPMQLWQLDIMGGCSWPMAGNASW
jgi:transposase